MLVPISFVKKSKKNASSLYLMQKYSGVYNFIMLNCCV